MARGTWRRRALRVWRIGAVAMAGALLLMGAGCSRWPQEVRTALQEAGENRKNLEWVLRHYEREGDAQKLEAAKFLIANMQDHCFIEAALYDKDRNLVPFQALDYRNFDEAQAALDALEKEHGELHGGRKREDKDLEVVTIGDLVENIDLAFEAWRTKPWAKDLSFDTFLNTVLPYRGSNEPIERWRAPLLERSADFESEMKDPTDAREAAGLANRLANSLIGFQSLFYMHPTDQGFQEMCRRHNGRCEDITNMTTYVMRANAIASAADYTPYWAHRDNNHAWLVILDENGEGRDGVGMRAAKVYRKTYAIQRDSLGYRMERLAKPGWSERAAARLRKIAPVEAWRTPKEPKEPKTKIPRWLSGKTFVDVTAQYFEPTDVTVTLEQEAPEGETIAYLSVFNGGEWQPIQWGEIVDGQVTFADMGRNICYLPSYYVRKEPKADEKKDEEAEESDEGGEWEVVGAAAPLIVTPEGEIRTLGGDAGADAAVEITTTKPEVLDPDLATTLPSIVVEPGKEYEMFVWDREWKSLGKKEAGEKPVAFDKLPSGRLYWLTQEGPRRLERIFTVESGKQCWW